MTTFFLQRLAPLLLASSLLLPNALAQEHPSVKHKFDLPPAADLSYAIKAKKSGLTLTGNALLQWMHADKKYQVRSETHAMLLGKILETTSSGSIDAFGIAPATFTEKRLRKEASTTTFDRSANNIRFAASERSYPLTGGEQDRSSMIWQLIAIARAAPEKFKAGSTWDFFVAGQKDAEAWRFTVMNTETLRTPLGQIAAVHVQRMPPPDAKEQQLDLWLAPSLEWYPLRLRFTEPDGDVIEQTLERIEPK